MPPIRQQMEQRKQMNIFLLLATNNTLYNADRHSRFLRFLMGGMHRPMNYFHITCSHLYLIKNMSRCDVQREDLATCNNIPVQQ